MRKYIVGFAVGLSVGFAATLHAASITGEQGYLMGFEVAKGDSVICQNPYVWLGSVKQIQCD